MTAIPQIQTYILDVRTPSEYVFGHRRGAINFDLQRLMQGEFPEIPKDTHIEVYCASGNRSRIACYLLQQEGFTDVCDTGGYDS